MPATLKIIQGNGIGARVELKPALVRLGRHPDCEFCLDATAVSRFHAQVRKDADQFLVEDLNSRNGTFLNGQRVDQPTALKHNDRIRICDITLAFHDGITTELPTEPAGVVEYVESESTILSKVDAHSGSDMMVRMNAESKLRAILDISAAIGQTLELQKLFDKVTDSLFKIFPKADRALILFEDEGGRLVPKAHRHRKEAEDSLQFSRTIVQQSMRDKQAILSADASSDDRFSTSQSLADFRIRSVMCAPLMVSDQPSFGVIQLDTQSQRGGFNAEDLQILVSVCSQVSMAVENARLHEATLQQERTQRELAFATDVQAGFLPRSEPKLTCYRFWAYYEPAGQVGGDYYDFITLPNGHQAIVVADVSGKGVPAALLMAKASSDTRVSLVYYPDKVADALARLNNSICEAGLADRFITMVIATLEPKLHQLSISCAGHMSPIVRRANGELTEPCVPAYVGLPVGICEDQEYPAVDVDLGVGDLVMMYSDGINEAMNAAGQDYGIDRIRQLLKRSKPDPVKVGEQLLKEISTHVAGHYQSDDMTLVLFQRIQ